MRAVARRIGRAMPERERFSLVVDLANEPVGPRWLRGAATLACLCGAALALSPGLEPFASGFAKPPVTGRQFQMNAMLTESFGDVPARPSARAAHQPRRADQAGDRRPAATRCGSRGR